MFDFRVIKKSKKSKARLGVLKTPHGLIHTPAFVPVATKGALRGYFFDKAYKIGAEIFMMNTFHFFHNRRFEVVKKFGGLHSFLNIDFPLMTDSGGFQVFSLGFSLEHGVGKIANIFPEENKNPQVIIQKKPKKSFIKIFEEGIEFLSPFSGEKFFLTPETSIKIQKILGADIIFAFDECTSPLSSYEYTKEALLRTHRWLLRSLKEFLKTKSKQVLFGIVQGGAYKDLREESAKFVSSLPFFGFGIGGSLGKSKKDMLKVLEWTIPLLPENKPRHLLGIGEVKDLFLSVERGIDLFDCVIPTRLARHHVFVSRKGVFNIRKRIYLNDPKPLDPDCQCDVCQKYSRAYISHLAREKEINSIFLLVAHNLYFFLNLMKKIRKALKEDNLDELKKKYFRYFD